MFHAIQVFIWDSLIWYLIRKGPKLFKGPAGAYEHGRKTRRWLYRRWKNSNTTAVESRKVGEWDDSACAFLKGLLYFDYEEGRPPEGYPMLHPNI